MAYVSLTLKYRPQTFADVVGQEHVTRTLRNAVAGQRVHHAYLFSGPRGTGKTSVARVLGKALNCEQGPTPDPCGVCSACEAIREGRALDIMEIDAASNRGIDEIRDLREKVKYSPAEAKHKLYILDEVHMLTTEAFNALLKTLEEPPAHAFFVLATTEPHRVPLTIVSRCQRFDFRRLGVPAIKEALERISEAEGIGADSDSLAGIARAADGSMRDAQSILDQMVAYAGEKIDLETVNSVLGATEVGTLTEIVAAVLAEEYAEICRIVERLIAAGKDLGQLLDDLMQYARDLSRLSLGCEPVGPAAGAPDPEVIREQANALGAERAMALMTHFAEVRQAFRQSTQHGLLLETALLEAGRRTTQPEPVAAAPAPLAPPQPAPSPTTTVAPTPAVVPKPAAPERPRPEPIAPRASEPAPPAPPAGTPASDPLRLEVVRQHWPNVEGELRRMGRYPVWALVQYGEPTAIEGNRVTLTFAERWKVLHGKVSGDTKQVLEQAAGEVLGAQVEIDPVLAEGGEGATAPAQTDSGVPGSNPSGGSALPPDQSSAPIEQVKETFPGSRIVEEGSTPD